MCKRAGCTRGATAHTWRALRTDRPRAPWPPWLSWVAIEAAPAIEAVLALEALRTRRAGGTGPRFELRNCGLEVVHIGHEPLFRILCRGVHLALDFAYCGLLLLQHHLCPARTAQPVHTVSTGARPRSERLTAAAHAMPSPRAGQRAG